MRAWIGTSGYSYAAWKGSFYPKGLPAARMLASYAERFAAVEINSTFFRMPKREALAAWRDGTPPGFRFTAKAPAVITHRLKLRGIGDAAARFASALEGFGGKRGPALMQLPPTLALDLPLLRDALAAWPPTQSVAVEFRHASWFTDAVYDALRAARAALCVAESDELATPRVATASWGYLRLRRAEYAPRDIAGWAEWIARQAWDDAYGFLKHEDQANGPRFAAQLVTALDQIAVPTGERTAEATREAHGPAAITPKRKPSRAPAPRRGAARMPRASRRR